jgi:hypothetical protein
MNLEHFCPKVAVSPKFTDFVLFAAAFRTGIFYYLSGIEMAVMFVFKKMPHDSDLFIFSALGFHLPDLRRA